MNFDLPIPHCGDRLSAARTAQLHREVRQNRILPSPGIKVIRGPNGTHITVDIPKTRPKDKPLPYEVRFDQDLDSGNGGWKIYLPTEHLLSYAGVDIQTSDFTGVTQIQDSNGDDTAWYSLDDIDLDAGHVWLQISKTSGTVTAEFVGDPEEGEEGEEEEEPVKICIAEVSYTPPASTVPAKIAIFQSVVGALRVGNDGLEPDNISTERLSQEDQASPVDPTVGKLQIKGWHTPSPVANQSLAAALSYSGGSPSSLGHLVLRDTQGALKYLSIGTLTLADVSALNGVTLVTNVEWIGSPTYVIRVTKRTASVANGVLTLGAAQTSDIQTTPLSGESSASSGGSS